VAHYTTTWQLGGIAAAVQDSIGRYSRFESGYSNFSPFSITSNINILPLRFISFSGSMVQNDALLTWRTDNEVNTSHFDVEFSSNGLQFVQVGRIKAVNAWGVNDYSFKHQAPIGNDLYYRLKQTDMDGKFVYSSIVRIRRISTTEMLLSPNPTQSSAVLFFGSPAEKTTLRMFSNTGQLVLQQQINEGAQQHRIDVSILTPGVYTIQLQSKAGTQVLRLVKQ
jgi:hypothetical protein